jgi:hypothetical protein
MEWDLTVRTDPGDRVGQYLALFNGSIDGSMCYLGLQTAIVRPGSLVHVGKGLIFSTWWSFDASDTRLAPGGFRELGTHEGNFVGVRRPYRWTIASYRVTLSRSEAEVARGRVLDWFDLSIQSIGAIGPDLVRPAPTGPREWIGGIRFPRRDPDHAAAIEPGGSLFLEVYSGAHAWEEVPPWDVDVMAFGDGTRCPSGRTEYPRPYGEQVPNVSVGFDPLLEQLNLRLGTAGLTQIPPGSWG